MSCCLFCVFPKGNSHLSTADGCAGYLVNRMNLFRNLLINLLSRDAQISPDKNVNFPCTNAAFRTYGFRYVVQTHPGAKPCMRFLFVISHVCHRASFRPLLAEMPLPSASTFGSIHYYEHPRFSYRGLPPHKFTPMPGVHYSIHLTPIPLRSIGASDAGVKSKNANEN